MCSSERPLCRPREALTAWNGPQLGRVVIHIECPRQPRSRQPRYERKCAQSPKGRVVRKSAQRWGRGRGDRTRPPAGSVTLLASIPLRAAQGRRARDPDARAWALVRGIQGAEPRGTFWSTWSGEPWCPARRHSPAGEASGSRDDTVLPSRSHSFPSVHSVPSLGATRSVWRRPGRGLQQPELLTGALRSARPQAHPCAALSELSPVRRGPRSQGLRGFSHRNGSWVRTLGLGVPSAGPVIV